MTRITVESLLQGGGIEFYFVRASGPGGQNVNKLATAAELRFSLIRDHSLPEEIKQRLRGLARNRINRAGVLIITAQRFRTQERNRSDALEKLVTLARRAAIVPKRRIPTKPGPASRRHRLDAKRRVSEKKRTRHKPHEE